MSEVTLPKSLPVMPTRSSYFMFGLTTSMRLACRMASYFRHTGLC
jgi:hypothetical protein